MARHNTEGQGNAMLTHRHYYVTMTTGWTGTVQFVFEVWPIMHIFNHFVPELQNKRQADA